jgi:hypothetical protein
MKRINIAFIALLTCISFLAGCSVPKPMKLDGSDRVPVNKIDIEKDTKEGGQKK